MTLQTSLPGASGFAVKQTRILVVDDEALIRETVALALTEEGYQVQTAANGQDALTLLCPDSSLDGTAADLDSQPNLAIVDLMLPGMGGLDICRIVRHRQVDLPMLILSAKGSEMDRVVGLEVGADDYLAKPFGMRELIARCRALLRRHYWTRQLPSETVLSYGDIVLSFQELRVTVLGHDVNLSPKEFRILELFMRTPNRVWSREEIIHAIWGPDFTGDRKTVDVHIRWLREKIEPDPSHPRYITTLRGLGYRFG